MDSLFFLCMLIGIAWLCWWSTRPPGGATGSRRWAPFDMLEPADERAVPDAAFLAPNAPRAARRGPAAASAEPQRPPQPQRPLLPHQAVQRRVAPSWRERGKPPGVANRDRRG